MSRIASNIQKLRKADGLSQEDFAEKVGVTRQTVSRWENGEGDIKSANIDSICKAYNISAEQLLGDNDFKIVTINQKTGEKLKGGFVKETKVSPIEHTEKTDSNNYEAENNGTRADSNKTILKEGNLNEYEFNSKKDATENVFDESSGKDHGFTSYDKNYTNNKSRISNKILYPVRIKAGRDKKKVIKKTIAILIIFILIMYILISLSKFIMLSYIINKASKYKNADNYYMEVNVIRNNVVKETKRISYKGNKYKKQTIRFDDTGKEKENNTIFLDKNQNSIVILNEIKNEKLIKNLNDVDYNLYFNDFFFNQLPGLYMEGNKNLFLDTFNNKLSKIYKKNGNLNICFEQTTLVINFDSYLPMQYIDSSEVKTIEYYDYKFNCVTDEDVTYK